jgi:hypothetical protein
MVRTLYPAALMLTLASGCDPDTKPAPTGAGSATGRAPGATSGAVSSAAGAASAAPSAAAPGSAGAGEASALGGTWEGAYDAKKGTVAQPSGHKDKIWAKDDGKTAIGAGTIKVVVKPGGDIEGEAKGALGDQLITGKADGNVLRATVSPRDPKDAQGYTGILVALLKDGALKGELKAAGPTADFVRESDVELKKK